MAVNINTDAWALLERIANSDYYFDRVTSILQLKIGTRQDRLSFFKGELDLNSDFPEFNLMTGNDLIKLDEIDEYSVGVFNRCIAAFLGISGDLFESNISQYVEILRNKLTVPILRITNIPSSFSNLAELRDWFSDNKIHLYDSVIDLFSSYCYQRCVIWKFHEDEYGFSIDNFPILIKAELRSLSEVDGGIDTGTASGLGNVRFMYDFLASNYWSYSEPWDMMFAGRPGDTNERKTAFYRVFSRVEASQYSVDAGFPLVVAKLESIGLLRLASYAFEISEFAKKRFRSKDRLQRSVFDSDGTSSVIDEKVDLPWLQTLTEVVQSIRRDPIMFSSIVYYFPSLITFLLDTLAAVGDYSNDGRGGGSEDEDALTFLSSLEKAFGVTKDGKSIFTLAVKASMTSEIIKAAIKDFRESIPPANPDIFHLRLGAANFYVPPLGIDVNTVFKAGSLTGGAIRQKNSPKFNSGYRETSVRMRLFFPNYEEIWGISIDDGSTITVDKDFIIDFKAGGSSEEKIDKFLSSLRGLVAAFRYSPILPIKNHYLNSVHRITGVCLSNMTVSTVPNFPFVLMVDLELLNFNHEPFLPMIKDFNQSVHWGKYRQYMGKAAGSLHSYVNEGFLLKTGNDKSADLTGYETIDDELGALDAENITYNSVIGANSTLVADNVYKNDVYTQNVKREWEDGSHIVFYAPAETQTKIFLPDTSTFRTEQEKLLTDLGKDFWESLLNKIGIPIDINQSAGYGLPLVDVVNLSENLTYSKSDYNLVKDYVSALTAGVNTDNNVEKVYLTLMEDFVQQNSIRISKEEKEWLLETIPDYRFPLNEEDYNRIKSNYPVKGQYYWNEILLSGTNNSGISLNAIKDFFLEISEKPEYFLDFLKTEKMQDISQRTGSSTDEASVKEGLARAFNVAIYNTFFKLGNTRNVMEARRARYGYRFYEWEVPMIKIELDPKSVIINNISVNLSNNFSKLQVQMHDEPTYQHIGGGDSSINVSMTVIGEKELIKLKGMLDHISGLARLEHATGVIGFLGVKNIISALCGIKYVLPLNYRVNTIPNYPHVYSVELSLIDFDIFQQKREKLSSSQQKELITEFATKKNPFLRIKQMWGAFNAYPDFPLQVKNDQGEVVGHLDPDFYFRSFEMFDRDVVNSISDQTPRVQNFVFDPGITGEDVLGQADITLRILQFLYEYNSFDNKILSDGNTQLNQLIEEMREYLRTSGVSIGQFISIFDAIVSTNPTTYQDITFSASLKNQLLTDFIVFSEDTDEFNPYLSEVPSAPFRQGDISPNSLDLRRAIGAMLEGQYSLANEEYVSFDPDEVDFHKIITLVPATGKEDLAIGQIPAICETALGVHFGYVNKNTGRFYLTVNGDNVIKNQSGSGHSLLPNLVEDTQVPSRGNTVANTGVPGVAGISEYQNAYEDNLYTHMEKMMVDASYRDISGRMLRAFPTYMLWLIDEGGYFAGAKLFDNFYGLQSIIDFSVVTSEDLLGDTLILRLSNLYSKLTTPESSEIFNPNIDQETGEPLELIDGIEAIIARTLNFSKNILSHMRNEYVTDFASIRLKPGVRLHLRAGYGANPNSLQTIFNGVITNVEPGEIVTVVAQSDAIELGAIINSTDKKGDSGKVDGGINTGLWLSEPRDLMVRLLSMGASRVRESFARATRGTIFSENRFGIRHFGSVLYQLSETDAAKNEAIRNSVASAFLAAGGNDSFSQKALDVTAGFSFNSRGSNMFSAMWQMWSNAASSPDLEIFKRNIYPGNGTGIAQFLGNDIDDGWLTIASLVPQDKRNDRVEGYLGRLTDIAWNNLVTQSGQGSSEASEALDSLTQGQKLISEDGAGLVKAGFAGLVSVPATMLGGPVTTTLGVGTGLLGILSGRRGTDLFRTLGIISPNGDDDLPGFDEVSFRAQTYMRTVWDMFQLCSRMLPNYIVAVRPFEDRSTIFYGKPHWLYTSGIVPVTTGYPGDEEASKLGLPAQKIVDPDQDLQKILDAVNANSNPYADYNAYFESFESQDTFSALNAQMRDPNGIFAPTSRLYGKIINFYARPALEYYEGGSKEPSSKMPVSKGKVTIGFHLPITNGIAIEAEWESQKEIHQQIYNLPPRFGFPFFTASSAGGTLIKNSEVFGNYQYLNGAYTFEGAFNQLTAYENKFFEENRISIKPPASDDGFVDLDSILSLTELEGTSEPIAFSISSRIRMPYPVSGTVSFDDEDVFEQTDYSEWGAPNNPKAEQFYIAMRWPYKPSKSSLSEAFRTQYELGDSLIGTASDYKKRRILVYSPLSNRAVVCQPAYFMWGESEDIDAVVSPDAAYYLGIITKFQSDSSVGDGGATLEAPSLSEITRTSVLRTIPGFGALASGVSLVSSVIGDDEWESGFRAKPEAQECYMCFVPDDIPLGVVATSTTPINQFSLVSSSGTVMDADALDKIGLDDQYLIGFGKINSASTSSEAGSYQAYFMTSNRMDYNSISSNDILDDYRIYNSSDNPVSFDNGEAYPYGGNPLNVGDGKTYFDAVFSGEYSSLERSNLNNIISNQNSSGSLSVGSYSFVPVYSPFDEIGFEARNFYDEDFNPSVNVIAGNGRTVDQANQIWNEFRTGYHLFESVKKIFVEVYGLDPDSDSPFPEYMVNILKGLDKSEPISKFKSGSDPNALDEFAVLLGSDYVNSLPENVSNRFNSQQQFKDAIEFARENYIDAPLSEGGLIEYFNTIIVGNLKLLRENFLVDDILNGLVAPDSFILDSDSEESDSTNSSSAVRFDTSNLTPRQLFLIMVGVFRQRLWEDPYGRAWLVLKPNRKRSLIFDTPNFISEGPLDFAQVLPNLNVATLGGGDPGEGFWSFRPVDVVFREFINPYNDIAKPSKNAKFKKLLAATRSEGNSNTTIISDAVDGIGNFFQSTIGAIWSAMTDSLSALLGMYKLNMQQMGYALSEVGHFGAQANILNKALNDSIYYSLGRPGSILRAVDNPFTREYGEPVLEIREPFQRIHYISSFNHILTNRIQENLNGVATVVTAVSDGKYPVTVALDKGAPAERQVEKTVETGLYFDNMVGSGFTGFLHPLFHPIETARGVTKNIQGNPDELMAKRVALAHLKESIKDVYGGEVTIIGNADIRPHDLVYIADVYERMYGIFEVEQVVHHFTPELGFVTAITPNALVTVNDPARWFISSWIGSWLNIQTIRNDTRAYLDNIRSSNSGISVAGSLSMDALGEALTSQINGGIQYTHGSTALMKDLISNQTAQTLPGKMDSLRQQSGSSGVSGINLVLAGVATAVPVLGQLAWKGWKYIRDNLLDQHGCYVQYLTKNGQPMDAGLSYNQGMTVGRYHSKAMLPGILGVRSKVRTEDGYAYIRSDDLFKSLGWQEKEITGLVRYLSYENALVHARVLKLSGLGPEKTALQPQYKIICRAVDVIDGDTLKLVDCISGSNLEFNLRFTGVDTAELNVIEGRVDYSQPGQEIGIIDTSTPAGRAKVYVQNALKGKLFIVTVSPDSNQITAIVESDYDPGSRTNYYNNYTKDQFNRVLGTIFYYFPQSVLLNSIQAVEGIIRNKLISLRFTTDSPGVTIDDSDIGDVKNWIKESFNSDSVFRLKFDNIYSSIDEVFEEDYFSYTDPNDVFTYFSEQVKKVFNNLVYMKCLDFIYEKTREWPLMSWDEYYEDGYPVSLNWELVVNNLARVYVKDLQRESSSVIGIDETSGLPRPLNN